MQETELALRRWKTIYDQLVLADRQLAAHAPEDSREAVALRGEIARLRRESDAALAELNRCVASMNQKGAAAPGTQGPQA